MPELEVRGFEFRAAEGDSRELVGIAVPFGEEATRFDYRESFERGAFDDFEGASLSLFYGHGHLRGDAPIGVIHSGQNTDAGYKIRARISETPRGDEAYRLAQDGALKALSIGFEPIESRVEEPADDEPLPLVVRTKASLREVSLVPFPAYQGAAVSQVREATTTTTKEAPVETDNATRADLIEVRESVEDVARRLDVLSDNRQTDEPAGSQFRSYGEYVKAYAAATDEAVALYRAWTGGTSADSVLKTGWIGDLTRLVERSRKVVNAFGTAPLPAEGNTLEYARLKANTVQVAQQVNEADLLAYGKVSIETATAPVKTYGGYSTLTRQEIERASVPILDRTFQALAIAYAAATEAAARAAVDGADAKTISGASVATYDGWIDFLADAAVHLDDKGLSIDGVLISADVFKAAAKMKSGDRYLLDRTQGSIDVTGLGGSILDVPFTVVSGTNVATVFNKTAMTVRESSGAPARLSDQDITNLTVAHSVYGYAAFAVEDPKALVKRGA